MKTIATLIFVLFIGVAAQAQNATEQVKVETIEMTIVTSTENKEVVLKSSTEVARLYKYKNSRIKKALSFTTKRNKAKMA
jgi:L-cystine uptake protein TcyP (sodium:dicarboxylate symporter family)